ncbi:HD domain-containing phosphohydrolase [Pseudothermotoga sp. U03pept]|uniref:HD domain-containing phosphohydrolase n=1 Tax=Pseudothermotoga sp. U03pept TaxID=3447012 RepID=UPI0030AD2F88
MLKDRRASSKPTGKVMKLPKLNDFLENHILRNTFLLTLVISFILFLTVFFFVFRIFEAQELVRITQLDRNWTNTLDSFGKLLIVLSAQTEPFKDEESVRNLTKKIYENYHPFVAYPAFGSNDGKMISYPDYDYGQDYDPRKRPWYQTALQDPQNYVFVKPFTHRILNEPTMAVAKAVYDERENLLGVLVLDLIVSKIAENLLSDRSYIIDRTGQILAKRGTIKATFTPSSSKAKEVLIVVIGLNRYIAKPSTGDTYVVIESSLLAQIAISLIPSSSVLLAVLIVNFLAVKRMKSTLNKIVIDPVEKIVESLRSYLSGKPFEIEKVSCSIYETRMLAGELSDMVTIIESQMQELKASYEQLEASQQELEDSYKRLKLKEEEVILAYKTLSERLGMVIENFDEPTGKHIQRVSKLSKFLAEKFNLPKDLVKQIELYAPLHDIGKIKVPTGILNKPGRLTQEEFELVRKHVLWGSEIIGNDKKLEIARNIVLYHHERYDGSGYPFGLKGNQIPIEAQIVTKTLCP